MRLKFFKRSAEKFNSRTDPDSEAYRDLRVIFPGACPGNRVQGSALGFIPFNSFLYFRIFCYGFYVLMIRFIRIWDYVLMIRIIQRSSCLEKVENPVKGKNTKWLVLLQPKPDTMKTKSTIVRSILTGLFLFIAAAGFSQSNIKSEVASILEIQQ